MRQPVMNEEEEEEKEKVKVTIHHPHQLRQDPLEDSLVSSAARPEPGAVPKEEEDETLEMSAPELPIKMSLEPHDQGGSSGPGSRPAGPVPPPASKGPPAPASEPDEEQKQLVTRKGIRQVGDLVEIFEPRDSPSSRALWDGKPEKMEVQVVEEPRSRRRLDDGNEWEEEFHVRGEKIRVLA